MAEQSRPRIQVDITDPIRIPVLGMRHPDFRIGVERTARGQTSWLMCCATPIRAIADGRYGRMLAAAALAAGQVLLRSIVGHSHNFFHPFTGLANDDRPSTALRSVGRNGHSVRRDPSTPRKGCQVTGAQLSHSWPGLLRSPS